MTNSSVTQSRLKELFSYDPESGVLTRVMTVSSLARDGEIAGTQDPKGYLRVAVDGSMYLVHRLIWRYVTGEWPKFIDHVNHYPSDNRWVNLRSVSRLENAQNKTIQANNSTGITGVLWCKTHKLWKAYISSNGHRGQLGYRKDYFEACCLRKSAEVRCGYHENHGL